jgi:TatD DNase family protein
MSSTDELPPLVDTHAHLEDERFRGEVSAVVERARAAGLVRVVVVGTGPEDSLACLQRARSEPLLAPAVGLHPTHLNGLPTEAFDRIAELAQDPLVVAIGETGLDDYWKEVPMEVQIQSLRRHLALSRQTGKAIILHCRDAATPLMAELRADFQSNGPLRGVLHSFCGDAAQAEDALAMGLHLSFSGMITQKGNQALRDLAAGIPRDRLLVETDSPYLAPRPHRGQRNEPAFVVHTCQTLAECQGITLADMARVTTDNARRLFGL